MRPVVVVVVVVRAFIDAKQLDYNRPFFFECLEVSLFEVTRSQTEKLGECRIPLLDIGKSKWYKVVRPAGSNSHHDIDSAGRLKISTKLDGELNSFFTSSSTRRFMLFEVFPAHFPQHKHLYLDVKAQWDPSDLLGGLTLPGPTCGETILDMHTHVEVHCTALHYTIVQIQCSAWREGEVHRGASSHVVLCCILTSRVLLYMYVCIYWYV